MKTIINPFQEFNDNGIYPELDPFGTGKSGGPNYEFLLYVKGLNRSIILRRGAPGSTRESRLQALERIIILVEIVMQYKEYLNSIEFWNAFDYHSQSGYESIDTPVFRAGQNLRELIKTETTKHFQS